MALHPVAADPGGAAVMTGIYASNGRADLVRLRGMSGQRAGQLAEALRPSPMAVTWCMVRLCASRHAAGAVSTSSQPAVALLGMLVLISANNFLLVYLAWNADAVQLRPVAPAARPHRVGGSGDEVLRVGRGWPQASPAVRPVDDVRHTGRWTSVVFKAVASGQIKPPGAGV